MDTVRLKSKYPAAFRRRIIKRDECGNPKYEMRLFEFNLDNGFRCEVPVSVWQELEDLFYDKDFNLKYKDIMQPI